MFSVEIHPADLPRKRSILRIIVGAFLRDDREEGFSGSDFVISVLVLKDAAAGQSLLNDHIGSTIPVLVVPVIAPAGNDFLPPTKGGFEKKGGVSLSHDFRVEYHICA